MYNLNAYNEESTDGQTWVGTACRQVDAPPPQNEKANKSSVSMLRGARVYRQGIFLLTLCFDSISNR